MCDKIENEYSAMNLGPIAELDLTLIAGKDGQSFAVNRRIMATSNKYFSALLGPSFKESNENRITLVNIDGLALKLIINYCYTGNIEISDENVDIILAAASSMEFVEIEQKCFQHLLNRLTVANCVHHFRCADEFNVPELRKRAFDEIVEKFSIVSPNDFLLLNDKLAMEIFNCDKIGASEENVFHAVQMWILINEVKCPDLVRNLLHCVRLKYISAEFFDNSVEPFFKQHNYQQILLDEYRRRVIKVIPKRLERFQYLYGCYAYRQAGKIFFDIKRYDLKDNKWYKYKLFPLNVWNSRELEGITILHYENRIYIIGSWPKSETHTFMRLDLTSLEQTNLPAMNEFRYGFGSVAVGGKIYVLGGFSRNQCLVSCDCFDTKLLKWENIEPMSTARFNATYALLNGDIYVVGGDTGFLNVVERYSPKTNKWTKIASTNKQRYVFQLTELNGYLYTFRCDLIIKRYDLTDNSWTKIGYCLNDKFWYSSLFPMYNDIYGINRKGQFLRCRPKERFRIVQCARFDVQDDIVSGSPILFK